MIGSVWGASWWAAWGNAWGQWTAEVPYLAPGGRTIKNKTVQLAPVYAPVQKRWNIEDEEALMMCGGL